MIKLIQAEEKHLDQLVPYFASTGYFEATAKNNLLNLDPFLYIRDYRIKPTLPITTVAIKDDDKNNVLGMITCASTKQLKLHNIKRYSHPKFVEMFKPYSEFEIPESYHVSTLAISKELRGQGIGKTLLKYAEAKAKENGCDTLSLLVWNCQTSAIKLYLNMGMMVTKTISFTAEIPFKTLLYFEKNLKTAILQDYFETVEYANLQLLK